MVFVQSEFDNLCITNGIEGSQKKIELKKEYENLLELKQKNKILEQQLYDRKREMFTLEVKLIN